MSCLPPSRSMRFWLVAASLCASGCAGVLAPAFDDRFADNDKARTAAVVARLQQSTAADASPESLLLATTHGAKPELVVYDLARSRVRFRVTVRAQSRPELLGDLVAVTAEHRVLGFDAKTGQPRLNAEQGDCTYLGSARDSERLFFTCETAARGGRGQPSASVTAIDLRSGRQLWQHEAKGALGRPAAANGLVLVPWQRQYLSILDARNGHELARLRSDDDVIEWVRAQKGGVFFGQHRLYRLGRHGYAGNRNAARYASVPSEQLPGRPSAIESAFAPQPGSRSARGRIALYLEPEAAPEDGVRIAYDRYYLAFYRYLFAYETTGALLWVRVLPHDVIAGQAVPAGVVVVSDDGRVLLLGRDDGAALLQADVGNQLAAATLDATALAPKVTPPPAVVALRRGLTEIALDTDNRLVPARAYAISRLAELDEPEVTRDLLDIYAQSAVSPELARVVADALRSRRHGLEHLVDALAARYDFLEQSRPAPLAVIVPALTEAHETSAAPRLVERMLDHETPLGVLPAVVHAVVELGDDGVLAPLLSFLRLYRADSTFAAQPEALIEAARGVLLHGGEKGPDLLASVTVDGRASSVLASGISGLEQERHAPQAAETPVVSAGAASPTLPQKLSQEAVDATFAEHIDDLRACIIDELGRNPELALLRIAFIAESDGSTHALSFAPNTPAFVDCLYPKVAAYRFPRFASGRVVARYAVALRAHSSELLTAARSVEESPWWDWYAARPRSAAPGSDPWWHSQQPLAAPAGPTERASPIPAPSSASASPAPAPQPQPTVTPKLAPAPEASSSPSAPSEDAWWQPAAKAAPAAR